MKPDALEQLEQYIQDYADRHLGDPTLASWGFGRFYLGVVLAQIKRLQDGKEVESA